MALLFGMREDFRSNVPISLRDLSFITIPPECRGIRKRTP